LLDRDAVRRVLRRASDLAADDGSIDVGEVSEAALVEAAREVGISPVAIRRAVAVERLDQAPHPKVGDRLVGARVVVVDAEVSGSPEDVLGRLDGWFVHGHHLRRDRLRVGHGVWTMRKGIVGRTVRSVRVATGEGRLGRAHRVAVSTSATGVGTTMVRVQVDRTLGRRTAAAAGIAVAGVATAVGLLVAVAAAPVAIVAVPVGLAAGSGVAATGRSRAGAVADEIDRVLDAVDDHLPPTRLRTDLARRAVGRPTVTVE
jgi:hypothetical protein